ncbi:MAG: hypothetical protein JSV99_02530 [Planctomycetota bacterium]|nr:MAG: hypothetical protein JSV99_02530 [Planctomycetota bacterium]
MKKILFMVLAVAVLVVPAWAVVTISALPVQVDVDGTPADTDEVAITYSTDANVVRAFAVDIVVVPQDGETDGNCAPLIVAVNEAALDPCYWVYPGSIDINEAGEVNDFGTPVGDPCQLPSDTQPGLDSNGITIEMGSLYVGETPPASSGVLLKIVIDDNCKITMSENVSRGGIVMEGVPAKDPVNFNPGNSSIYTGPQPQEWRRVGRPKCWCRYKGGRQCHGDADGMPYGKNNYYVSIPDADIFNAAQSKPYSDMIDPNGDYYTLNGVPWICADFDHLPYGKNDYRVSIPDADVFNLYQSIADGPDANCL